ncbi:MAG: hypothetical protein KBA75_06115 [Alphaproteobacteria bacterium]|nr:hypothetical protein [Alphaproteobacteria bacterium]
MARFIDQPPSEKNDSKSRGLVRRPETQSQIGSLAPQRRPEAGIKPPGRIPNASLIYGAAAAVLLVFALYTLFKLANWLTGLLLLILAGTLAGYAWYFMRYR